MIRGLLASMAMAGILALGGCGCQQTGYKELLSPRGDYVAVERETNCGATEPYRTAISVRTLQPRLDAHWLGFTAKRVFLADVVLTDTHVQWLDDHDLEITCSDATCVNYGIVERVNAWRNVRIHFDVGKAKKGEF